MSQEYENNKAVRPCGSDFKYCDGNCDKCSVNNLTSSNKTEREKIMNEIEEVQETKDFLGQVLSIGDRVVYTHHTPASSFLIKGTIIGFKRKNVNGDICNQIEVQIATQGTLKKVLIWPDKAIKYTDNEVNIHESCN